ncbi:DUF4126 domain-containing protein [Microbacterium sp. No. 7]|uniref:DUF4126 domain-containing protein n=1 Tax=Microbacterium sp. No. 7 TaxID=1714373 RepID=UPI0006D1B5C5|nr:hypothetical protein AOA12_13000 [Microbacterium sp. No. 7]
MEFLVGSGLAAAAGLNAWMPLFLVGLADRFTDVIQLPATWAWLSSDVALWITGILLVVEIVADKVPAIDSVNDALQTVIRPASGGIAFGAGSSSGTLSLDDPASILADGAWIPIAVGIAIALGMHLLKAALRPVANVATFGLAAPLLSTVEDVSAFTLILLAVFVPILAGLLIVALVWIAVTMLRRARRRARAVSEPAA